MEPPPSEARVYSFGVFELDARLGELRKAGRKQKIAPQPLQVLQVLLEHPQDVVTREELRQRIWPEDIFVDYELALKKCINRIREILGDSAESPRFIETVPRRGYRFIANVEQVDRARTPAWAHEHPGAGSQAPEESVTSALAERPRGLAMRLTVLAAAVSCVMLAILVFVRLRPWEKFGAPSKAPSIRSLAVLPLENLSHDAEQEYFADGMTDALITDLAKIHALRVISRNSAMQYKSKHKSMPQIARELNVDAVVEGTVMRSGDRVRITAQLIEAPQDRHLWAETYEGDLRDILGLQDQVAKAIAAEIRVTLTPQEQVHLTNARRVDPQAEDAYLTGRYYWNRRATDAVRKSCDYFQDAIDKDPTYASAYAGLADCYNVLGYYRYQSPSETFARGKVAAQRALQIDESLAEAHASLAYDKLYYDFDWTGAEREYKLAIELNANYATAHHWYSLYLSDVARFEEAKAEIRRAFELDPLSPIISNTIAAVYFRNREYDKGIQQLHRLLEADPNFVVAHDLLGQFYTQKRMYGAAITEFQKARTLDPGDTSIPLEIGAAYALADRKPEAKRMLQEVKNISKQKYVPPYDVARFYACMGQNDIAFEWLDRALQGRDRALTALRVDPLLDNLRSDPRFTELLRRVGLTP